MDADRYLQRLDLDPATVDGADAATLTRLQRAHVGAVPFENLSIVGDPHGPALGDGVSLSLPDLYEKIVERRRGGLCFELNGAFAWLLEELGADVRRVAGRVYTGPTGELGPHESHLTLLVTLDHRYVVDVGFGDVVRCPLPMDGTVRETVDGDWRVVPSDRADAPHEVQFRPPEGDRWSPRYVFGETPRDLSSFEDARAYHVSDPEAPFTGDPVVTRATDRGRITLSRRSLTRTEGGEKRKQSVAPEEWAVVLAREFGVTLDAS